LLHHRTVRFGAKKRLILDFGFHHDLTWRLSGPQRGPVYHYAGPGIHAADENARDSKRGGVLDSQGLRHEQSAGQQFIFGSKGAIPQGPARPGDRRRRLRPKSTRRAVHSIISSARPSSASGTIRPSALAALRLITSSSLVGNWTGRSAGLAPFSIRSMYPAACRNKLAKSTP
jgi:hypothetical protein